MIQFSNYLFYTFIIIFLLAVILFLLMGRKKKHTDSFNQGLSKRRETFKARKKQAKDAIMQALKEKGKITNQEAQKLLKISDATATRYLQELENEGKIVQKGKSVDTFYTNA